MSGCAGEDVQPVRVTASTLIALEKKTSKMAAKNKQIKIISWVVGLPAAIIAISEPTLPQVGAVHGNRGAGGRIR